MALLRVGGAALPEPSDYGVEEESIGRFERNANGVLVGDLVGVKTKVSCGWKMLKDAHFQAILAAARAHFVSVSYYDPAAAASVTKEMAVSARSGRLAVWGGAEKWWADVAVTFTER